MEKWSLTAEQAKQYENDGYFTVRNVIPPEMAAELRGVIKNTVLMPEPDVLADADPMDPMGGPHDCRFIRSVAHGRNRCLWRGRERAGAKTQHKRCWSVN